MMSLITLGRSWALFGKRSGLAAPEAAACRISEATKLQISAIDWANHVQRVVDKGNKERLGPLSQPVLDELGNPWRTHRNARWLFPNRHG
jgi:integrase